MRPTRATARALIERRLRVWNSRHGWFKLAHVCRNWRLVVLASSSRLHLRLFFTVHRSPRAVMLTRLPPLPITIDYLSGANNHFEQNRLVTALKFPNRVHDIAFCGSINSYEKFFEVTNRPFPKLRRLVLRHEVFLSGVTPCLQHLWVTGAYLSSLSSLLSSAINLTVLEALLSGLAAPFLKDIYILPNDNAGGDSLLDPIPNLSRFIRDIDKPFSSVRVSFSEDIFRDIMLTDLCSTNESPFKIYVPGKMVSMAHICSELSVKLAEVEDLFLSSTSNRLNRGSRRYGNSIFWLGILKQFHNVKKLWVQCELKLEIAYFLGKDDGKPAMDLLPELKEIYLLCHDHSLPSSCCDTPTMVRNAFEPFCAARDRADLSVDLIWRKLSEGPFYHNN
ncbi:hypothetical protein B0F90DRAFT_1735735 [Multifurca ochricompacta]|uniref:Uncharacterized protein n=1 Tax=Multifurca ochricompacta TaxID=376703 RepID=A0AAD4QJH1_9AGAM|nr:hypothetical protein B0F90DRAFT_1735735 [Multifurca ochricompacta]